MNISGIYVAIIGLLISSIGGIIGIYDGSNKIISSYLLLIISIGAVISLIGIYLQWKESETIRIKVQFEKDKESDFFIFKVPYGLYRKKYPIISMIGPNHELCWFDGPDKIDSYGTIFIKSETLPNSERFLLIK